MSDLAVHLREIAKRDRDDNRLLLALVLDAADCIERLQAEGVPGQMHAIDRAFYKLTVNQRDAAWREVEQLKREIIELTEQGEESSE